MSSAKSIVTAARKPVLRHAYSFFKKRASSIAQVRFIAVSSEDGFIHFWTIIPRRDREVQRKIYAAELELMDQFPTFSYDFNVIFCSEDIATMLPSEAQIIYP